MSSLAHPSMFTANKRKEQHEQGSVFELLLGVRAPQVFMAVEAFPSVLPNSWLNAMWEYLAPNLDFGDLNALEVSRCQLAGITSL